MILMRGKRTYLVEVVVGAAVGAGEAAKTAVRVLVHVAEGLDGDLVTAVKAA